jgi:hypothetical protein
MNMGETRRDSVVFHISLKHLPRVYFLRVSCDKPRTRVIARSPFDSSSDQVNDHSATVLGYPQFYCWQNFLAEHL